METFLFLSAFLLIFLMMAGMMSPKFALPKFLAFERLPEPIFSRIQEATERPTRGSVLRWYLPLILVLMVIGSRMGESNANHSVNIGNNKFTREQLIQPCAGAGILAVDAMIGRIDGVPVENLFSKADRFSNGFAEEAIQLEMSSYYRGLIKAVYEDNNVKVYKFLSGKTNSKAADEMKVFLGKKCLKSYGFPSD